MATEHKIDAAGRSLGRIASEAAKALMGKTSADYTPNKFSDVKVIISNASKLHFSEKKRVQKVYERYSGYPGGLRREKFEELVARKGYDASIRYAVSRMLPNNTFRVARMKNLKITK